MTIISEFVNDAKFIFQYRRKIMGRQKNLDHQAPKLGDVAPDFTLHDITGTEAVSLSDYRGKKPVALIFGSFT